MGNPADSAEPLVTLHVYAPPLAAVATVSASGARGRAHLAVIGGGFCAADLAVLLARRGALAALDLTVIDPGRAVGRGVAYEAHADALLNVPAARMSMIPEEPGHFLAWARRRDPAVAAEDFLPRALYGAYIEETLAREAGGAVGVVKRRAMDVAQTESGWEVALEGGGRVAADAVVLATGNPPPAYPAGLPPELRADPRYIADP